MSQESGNGAATQPGNQPAVQPTTSQSNFVQVSPDDYARYKRAEEQARGAAQFYEKAKAAGFDRPEAFETYAQQQARLKKYGVNLDGVLASFESERGDTGAPVVDTDAIIGKATEAASRAADERWNYHDSRSKHTAAVESTARAVDEFVDKIEDLNATQKRWLKSDLKMQADAARRSNENLYDDSHPLRAYDFRPLPSDKLTALFAATTKELAASKAAALEAKGVAAQRPSGTPAGQGGSQGKPTNQSDKRSDGRPTKEVIAARVEKRLAAMKGGPVSSIAG